MKRTYITPMAEKLVFSYTDNVAASNTYSTTDLSTQWWECHSRFEYNDSPSLCGPKTEMSTAYWVCNNNS